MSYCVCVSACVCMCTRACVYACVCICDTVALAKSEMARIWDLAVMSRNMTRVV